MTTLRDRVYEALDCAVDNGYDLRSWAASEVAVDPLDHCADLEHLEPDDVLPYVVQWQVEGVKR